MGAGLRYQSISLVLRGVACPSKLDCVSRTTMPAIALRLVIRFILILSTQSEWSVVLCHAGPCIGPEGTGRQSGAVEQGRCRIRLPGIANLFRTRHRGR